MKQYIGISRDHSGSMSSLARHAMNDYNQNIAAIKDAAEKQDIDTVVSVVECGRGNRGTVERTVINSGVSRLKPLEAYVTDGSSTPLFDSVAELISILETAPDSKDPNVSFLVMAITDGAENSSKTKGNALGKKISKLQATDRWTFVFRVPVGYGHTLCNLGIPSGNIQEWEQTEKGIKESSVQTTRAFTQYYATRASGQTATDSFYADLKGVTTKQVKDKLANISASVLFFPVRTGGEVIKPFIERKLGHTMRLGSAFYQLSKAEKAVQSNKLIAIRDKFSGDVYAGVNARDLLGLPKQGIIHLAPGDHGNFDVFIQSTSTNRNLVAGTEVMYWENVGL
jgi:hypothetical protein